MTVRTTRRAGAFAMWARRTLDFINGLLTGSYFQNPAWVTNPSLLRYMPTVLENPIENGISTDFQGNLIFNKIDNNASSNRIFVGDQALDYLIVGRTHFTDPVNPIGNTIQWTYARNLRMIGFDMGGWKLTISRVLDGYLEGWRTDATLNTIEDDALNIGGDDTDVLTARCVWTIQNYYPKGLHGSNRGHGAANTLAFAITSDVNKDIRIQLGQAPTSTVVVGQTVTVAGTKYSTQVRNLNDFNTTYSIKSITSQQDFIAACDGQPFTDLRYKTQIPASAATDDATGYIYVMQAGTGNHSDPIQHVNTGDKMSKRVRIHNMVAEGNYCGTILQNVLNRFISNWSYVFSHATPSIGPTDIGSEVVRLGQQAAAGALGICELFNVFGKVRPLYTIDQQISPSTLSSEKGVAGTSTLWGAARNIITWLRGDIRGGAAEGLPPVSRTNKCTNFNTNPVDTTGLSKYGDAAATITVVDDTTELTNAGLIGRCTSGKVYKLDNTSGSGNAYCDILGGTGNTNLHTASVYARKVGAPSAGVFFAGQAGSQAVPSASYTRVVRQQAPTVAANMSILATAGAVVYFVLNQLEEGNNLTDVITVAGAAATISNYCDYNALGFGYIQDNNRYYGYTVPLSSHITDIVFEGGTTTFSEDIAGGTAIGTFRTVHTLGDHPGIIDYSIVSLTAGALPNQFFWHGRRLVRGRTALDYSNPAGHSITARIRAAWRGTSPLQYFEKDITFTITQGAGAGYTLACPFFGASAVNAAPVSPQDYGALAIGTANADRYVLVFAANWYSVAGRSQNATATLTNATNGAQTLNKLAGRVSGLANGNYAEAGFYIGKIPADTTTTALTIATSGAATAGGVATFALTAMPNTNAFCTNTAVTDAVGGQCILQLDIPANGFAVIGCTYATPTGNNKRFSTAVITSATTQTLDIRATIAAGSAGPVTWETSPTGAGTWTTVNGNTPGSTGVFADSVQVEGAGGSGTVLVGASFMQ